MSDIVFKISRPSYEVLNPDINDKDLSFSAEFNTFKIYRCVYFSGSGSELHGLSYPPAFTALKERASGKWSGANRGYFEGGISDVYVSDTSVFYGGSDPCYVTLYIDPLNE